MHISRKVLIAVLALGLVAVDAAAPAHATTSTTTMSIGLTIVAPSGASARQANAVSKAGVERTSTGGKTLGIKPEVTTHLIANARADAVVKTLNY